MAATLYVNGILNRWVDDGLAGHSGSGGAWLDDRHVVYSTNGVARVPWHTAIALGLGIGSDAGDGGLFGVVGLAHDGGVTDTRVGAEDVAVVALIIFLCTRTIFDNYNVFGS